jgi:hypothetical protein
MATIYADADGLLIRFLQHPDEEARYPDSPSGSTQTLTFDETTNGSVVAAINSDWDSHRLVSGALQRIGVAVTINADAAATTVRKAVSNQGAEILAALQAGTATDAQIQRALAFLLARAIQG